MYAIVVGCGRVGAELAMLLGERGHEVTVIDHVGSSFSHLDPAWRGRTIEAEPMADGVLENAEVRRAGALAAVTNSDAVNAVVAHVARSFYRVPSVVSRNYDPRWRPLHEAMGLQMVSSTAWGAQRTADLLEMPALRAVLSAGNGEVEVYEVTIPHRWDARPLSRLVTGAACAVVSLTRAGRARVPAGDELLAAGDRLHVGAAREGASLLLRRLEQGEP
jgi:trk system potassium uptake protein TrkA